MIRRNYDSPNVEVAEIKTSSPVLLTGSMYIKINNTVSELDEI